MDVADPQSVDDFVAGALERHGRATCRINNAGVLPLSLVDATRVDDWNR